MFFRPAIFALFTLFIFASGMGCKKSESAAHAAPPTVLSQDTIASVHWVGKGQLDLKADACFFSRIWSLPETERLRRKSFRPFFNRGMAVFARRCGGGENARSGVASFAR